MAGRIGRLRLLTLTMVVTLVLLAVGVDLWLFVASINTSPDKISSPEKAVNNTSPTSSDIQTLIETTPVSVGGKFTVDVPNGWSAHVSTQQSFLAIQLGTPGTIGDLTYDKDSPPHVDYSGIASWSGLTEHFYVRYITSASQAFNPSLHADVSSSATTFTDGTEGTIYSVTKTTAEAKKWGGLLKDDRWLGTVYVYIKGDTIIEAHLARYPSTDIDTKVFEQVAKSIRA